MMHGEHAPQFYNIAVILKAVFININPTSSKATRDFLAIAI